MQRRWLNSYNEKIRVMVGAELKRQNKMDAFYWMMEKTDIIPEHGGANLIGSFSGTKICINALFVVFFARLLL